MAQKPIILALETSSRIGSVALGIGEKLLAETIFSEPLKHSAEIYPAISNLIGRFGYKPDQIEHIYISIGPGSFTGLRIAATAAKMMHLANAVKVVTVSSLDVIAANIKECTEEPTTIENYDVTSMASSQPSSNVSVPYESINRIATILDAKRGQFFIALYERGQDIEHKSAHAINWRKILPDSVMSPGHFLSRYITKQRPAWLLGDGLVFYKDRFKTDSVFFLDQTYWSPKASRVHLLGWRKAKQGQFANPLTMTPSYLLRPDIKIKTR